MEKTQAGTLQNRGTIIVDANAIYHLFCPVNKDFHDPDYTRQRGRLGEDKLTRIRHYLGILDFLSEHGFKIVIPEMVSMETGSVLACGTDVLAHVGGHIKEPPKLYDKQLVKLLQRVTKNRYPNIRIVQMDEAKAYSDHPELKELERTAEYLARGRAVKEKPQGSAEAFDAYVKMRRIRTKNFGEKAILGYILENNLSDKPNVFVLSDEREALEDIGKRAHVSVMNVNGLMSGFLKHRMHTAVGLKEDVDFTEIMTECAAHLTAIRQQPYTNHYRVIDEKWGRLDNDTAAPQYGYRPFSNAMRKLASGMHIKNWRDTIRGETKEPEEGTALGS